VSLAARDCLYPYHCADDAKQREFVRHFWADEPGTVTVCSLTDLGEKLYPGGWYAYYRCYQKLYSPRHRAGRRLPFSELAALDRPLRIVVYHAPNQEPASRQVTNFLKQLEPDFEPAGGTRSNANQEPVDFDVYGTYETLRLIPRRLPDAPADLAIRAESAN